MKVRLVTLNLQGRFKVKNLAREDTTLVPVKGTGCDEMNILWPNDSILSGLHDI